MNVGAVEKYFAAVRRSLMADFVAEVGDGKSEAIASIS
jgi:hypothetical protein